MEHTPREDAIQAPLVENEPGWLPWARELQAIAQTGLTFARDPYDCERYERLRRLASDVYAHHTEANSEKVAEMFAAQTGYATPKVDVRAAVFDKAHRLLMVREIADEGRWTLPGGWADVNLTAAENAAKETREESGYEIRVTKLAAAWDRTRQGHPLDVFSCCKLFFLGEVIGGEARPSAETSEVRWFVEAEISADLSLARVLPHQITRMFEHHHRPDLPTEFD